MDTIDANCVNSALIFELVKKVLHSGLGGQEYRLLQLKQGVYFVLCQVGADKHAVNT